MFGIMFKLVQSFFRVFEEKVVAGSDYEGRLKELMDICIMCNDSELSYNEVM